jgi:hypothetical protein
MKDIYKEIAGHKGYKRIYTRISCVEEDILHIIKRYPMISMILSLKRYPFISIKLILGLIRIKGYLGIS